jgi:3-hydroxyacyl-[acyl-carrier-protein] dehydratase
LEFAASSGRYFLPELLIAFAMPPVFLYDLSQHDLEAVEYDIEAIRRVNPQRHEFEQLTCVTKMFEDGLIARRDIGHGEFWERGHIPGRPLYPGVLQIEAAAQAASLYAKMGLKWEGFVGFGAVTNVKFRQAILPGQRLFVLIKHQWARHKRVHCLSQGIVDGNLAFEAEITGVIF